MSEAGEHVRHAGRVPMTPPPPDATLRTITVGGVAKPELLSALAAKGVRLNAMAQQLFDDARFVPAPTASVLHAWELTVGALGLGAGGTIDAILARAAEHGLVPGPLELGPHLRLHMLDQVEGRVEGPEIRHQAPPGALTVASVPLSSDEEFPCGFYLRRIDGALWLRGYRSWSGHHWSPDDRFAFVERPNGV